MQEISSESERCGHAGIATFVRLRLQFSGSSVKGIAHDGMADGGHVDADLVGASGFDLHFDERKLAIGRVEFS